MPEYPDNRNKYRGRNPADFATKVQPAMRGVRKPFRKPEEPELPPPPPVPEQPTYTPPTAQDISIDGDASNPPYEGTDL